MNRGRGHQFDRVSTRQNRLGPSFTPQPAAFGNLDSQRPDASERRIEVGRHNRGMTGRRHHRIVAVNQVNPGAVPFKPVVSRAERFRHGDRPEADRLPEAPVGFGCLRPDLERDMVEHGTDIHRLPRAKQGRERSWAPMGRLPVR